MGFDIKAAVDGIAAIVSQYYPFILAGLVLLLLFGSKRRPRQHPQGADR